MQLVLRAIELQGAMSWPCDGTFGGRVPPKSYMDVLVACPAAGPRQRASRGCLIGTRPTLLGTRVTLQRGISAAIDPIHALVQRRMRLVQLREVAGGGA